jgi:hypothetical protein
MQTRTALAAVAAAALTLSSGAQAGTPGRDPILGATFGSTTGELLRLDPVTLDPIGQPIAKLGFSWSALRSPDGARLVVTSGGDPLRILDPANGRMVAHLAAGRLTLTPGAWSRPDRLLAVTPWQHSSLVVLDPQAGRVLERRPLGGDVVGGVASRGRLILLIGAPGRIRPARLVVVSPSGRMRTVALPGIQAGTQMPPRGSTPWTVRIQTPGLAVDPAGQRAVVVGGDGTVALVNLGTLAVTTHRVLGRQLARARKELTGSARVAAWLTPTIVAVSGVDYATAADGTSQTRAAGLRLIHTGDWSSRLVDDAASQVVIAGSSALVTDSTGAGIGLRAYTPNGRMRFHLLGSEALDDMLVIRNRVYIGGCNSWCYRVVDPDAGRVISSPLPRRQTVLIA